jgi:hypothetical protein
MGEFKQAIHWFGRARIGYVERGDQLRDIEVALQEVQASLEVRSTLYELVAETRQQLERADAMKDGRLVGLALDLWLRIGDYHHSSAVVSQGRDRLVSFLRSGALRSPWIALAGTRLVYLGEPELGLGLARSAYLGLRSDGWERLRAINRMIISHLVLGLPQRRRTKVLLADAERIALGVGDLHARFSILCNRALWRMESSEWDAAERLFDAAERFSGGPRAVGTQTLAANRVVLAVRRFRPLAAKPFLDEMDQWLPSPRRSINSVYAACRLMVALEEGRISEASDWFDALQSFNPQFPFSSDLSLVPLACSAYLTRAGRRQTALQLLSSAAEAFGPYNPVAAHRVTCALERTRNELPVSW